MRQAFAHEAVVVLDAGADADALGAAVTVALCGHWDHPPPCPLAPHFSRSIHLSDGAVRVRVLFATEPDTELAVRRRVEEALGRGELVTAPDRVTRWELRSSRECPVDVDERHHAERLVES